MNYVYVKPPTVGRSIDPGSRVLDYPATWASFWSTWLGHHSMLRCPGSPCPGGCGAGAKSDLRALVKAAYGQRDS